MDNAANLPAVQAGNIPSVTTQWLKEAVEENGGSLSGVYFTSLPLQTRQDALRLFQLSEMRANDIDAFADGENIEIVHASRCPYLWVEADTGKRERKDRYILNDKNGKAYNIISVAAVGMLDSLISTVLTPPFDPPLRFRLKLIEVGQPSKLKTLEVII